MATKKMAGIVEFAVIDEVVLTGASKVSANIPEADSAGIDSTLNASGTSDSATCATSFDASSARWVAICSIVQP